MEAQPFRSHAINQCSRKGCAIVTDAMRYTVGSKQGLLKNMICNPLIKTSFLFIAPVLLFSSCKIIGPSNGLNSHPMLAPSRSLPAAEIMKLERITSIHYIDYETTGRVRADTVFFSEEECAIDTSRMRQNQYYDRTPGYNVSVYDLTGGISWNSHWDRFTYTQLPNLHMAYEECVQASLGGWLNERAIYVRSEFVDDKFCDVFTDSAGTWEWIWRDHRLPIQRQRPGFFGESTYIQKKHIEINIPLSDTLFTPGR